MIETSLLRQLRRPAASVLGLTFVAIAAASCSSSSGGLPTAGFGSPSAATSGFIQGLQSGTPQNACTYVDPTDRANCVAAFTGAKDSLSNVSLGNGTTQAPEALVAVTGNVCVGLGPQAIAAGAPSTTTCFNNSDKNLGLPSSPAGFAAAFDSALTSTKAVVACAEVNGQWFVTLGFRPAGASGGTTTTSAATTGGSGSSTTSPPSGVSGSGSSGAGNT